MRLFVAVELPDRLRTAVVDRATRAASGLPRASWVRAENLHLTLAFLGELRPDELPRLATALADVAKSARAFTLQLEGAGCFPPSGRARVAWLGFARAPEVIDLQGRLATALRSAVGFEPDRRGYTPHLTVARCSTPWPAAAARKWSGATAGAVGEPFKVESVALVKSLLTSGGATYHTVQRFELAGGTA